MRVYYVDGQGEENIYGDSRERSSSHMRTVLTQAAQDGHIRVGDTYIPWHRVIRVEK